MNPHIPYFRKVATGNKLPAPIETSSLSSINTMAFASPWRSEVPQRGLLVINADDWGRNRETTDRTLECFHRGVISSVSAMVFMQDSERAAGIAREQEIDAGLHLNFTTPFSAANCPRLVQHQQRIAQCLRRYRLAQALFHPTLMRSFEYVASAQLEQFCRLYGRTPERFDGHHHMHLCANVLLAGLLPRMTVVRRSFHFQPGERSFAQRLYYRVVDCLLVRRHRITDFFFSLSPLEPPARLQRIISLARQFAVEVETHPANPDEYRFLSNGEICGFAGDVRIARGFAF